MTDLTDREEIEILRAQVAAQRYLLQALYCESLNGLDVKQANEACDGVEDRARAAIVAKLPKALSKRQADLDRRFVESADMAVTRFLLEVREKVLLDRNLPKKRPARPD